MRILIAGIGNIFNGDDAFGCEVAAALAQRPLPGGVHVKDFGIRSYDLAYAIMDGYDAVILIDAMPRGQPPGALTLLEPDSADFAQPSAQPPDAHSMNPLTALQLVHTLGGEATPLYVIGCEPQTLESDEIALSPPVRAAIPAAISMIEDLLRELSASAPREPAALKQG